MSESFDMSAETLQARARRAVQDLADQAAPRANALVQEQERLDLTGLPETRSNSFRALAASAAKREAHTMDALRSDQATADVDLLSRPSSHPPQLRTAGQRLDDVSPRSKTPVSAPRIAADTVANRVSKRLTVSPHVAAARPRRAGHLPLADPGTVEIDGWRLRRVGVGEQEHWLYSRGCCEIRDQGNEIFLSDGGDPTAIRAWLTLAAARFGSDLELTGTALLDAEFRRQAAVVAVDLGLNVEQLAAEIADERRRRQPPSQTPAQVAEPPSFRIVKTHDPRHSDAVPGDDAASIDTDPHVSTERMKG